MSCVTASSCRVGGINADSGRVGGISAYSERSGGINACSGRVGGISAYSERSGGINAMVSLVCFVNKGVFLKVTPVEHQWIDVFTTLQYDIRTNVDWNIE